MGILGLASYILNHSEQFLESFYLHDTYLVIDGSNIACKLFADCTKCTSAFGGDYDKYAEYVRHFFWELQKCNVKPLVLMDGGHESRKSKTIMKRLHDREKIAESFTMSHQNASYQNNILFPILMMSVFKSILKEMNIRHIQCLFEADNAIASVAKLLNCPVLSADSDFYIYGALYIPFHTLENNIREWRKYVKPCKLYKVENLLNTFSGLTKSLLPLVATLLGNDYIQHNEFKHFYENVELPKKGRINWNLQQCRIEGTLNWLSKHTLNEAVCLIMRTVPHENRRRTLRAIEMIINEYSSISVKVLVPLGFSKEDIDKIILQNKENNCKFQTDISDLIKGLSKEYQDMNECDSETIIDPFINNLPSWFINEFFEATLTNYFMNILMHKLYIYHVQIEDYRQPSSIFISEKIVNVIFTLLKSEFEQTSKHSQYITRGENNQLTYFPIKYINNIGSCEIPSLHNLRETPMNIRKEIYDNTLNIQHDIIVKFPENWRLYIASAKYWLDNLPELKSDAHIYALLFAMLHHIIDLKIGYCRSMHTFKNKYKQKLETIECLKQKNLVQSKFSFYDCFTEISIIEALNEIMEFDCLMLAPFFISNSDINFKLQQNPKSYKRAVVHIFAQFQSCLKHSMDLNVLLGCPYQLTKVSDMFNGTLLYNLYNNFKKRKKIEDYIYCILQCSPNFCRLFHGILIEARLMFKLRV